MYDPRPVQGVICQSKETYATPALADVAIKRQSRSRRANNCASLRRAYRCQICRQWHITSTPLRDKPKAQAAPVKAPVRRGAVNIDARALLDECDETTLPRLVRPATPRRIKR